MDIDFKVINVDGSIEDFMKTEQFKKEINDPTKIYYQKVYDIVTAKLSPLQKELFDNWWNYIECVPSDECFWKNTPVPKGYEKYTALDIKLATDAVLGAISYGCG